MDVALALLRSLVTDFKVPKDVPPPWRPVARQTGQPMLYFICH